MKRLDIVNIIIFLLIFALAYYKYSHKIHTIKDAKFLLDTLIEIKANGQNEKVQTAIDSTFSLIENLEKKFSYYDEKSEIAKFNRNEIPQIDLDDDYQEIFALSKQIFVQTDSLYDVTIGSLTDIWNEDKVPSENSIKIALQNIGFDKLEFSQNSVLKPEDLKLNLGSLVKGYIVDCAVDELKTMEANSGYINAGGDMRIFGHKKDLEIGIQHPRAKDQLVATLQIKNKAIVTSGDYERFFSYQGKRYHHILNPKTGFPATKNIAVTVIADSTIIADAYSTALFLLSPEKAISLADQINEIEALVLFENDEQLQAKLSANFEKYILSWDATDIRKMN